jgi:hypothetical protein
MSTQLSVQTVLEDKGDDWTGYAVWVGVQGQWWGYARHQVAPDTPESWAAIRLESAGADAL